MLCKQLTEDTENESDHEYDVDADDKQDETSDKISGEDLVPGDSQMRDSHDRESLQLSQSRLKNGFLDRLAQVQARVKGEPGDVASKNNTYICTIYHALRSLGYACSTPLVNQRFQRVNKYMEDINTELNTLRCERRRVHAEVQPVHFYEI